MFYTRILKLRGVIIFKIYDPNFVGTLHTQNIKIKIANKHSK